MVDGVRRGLGIAESVEIARMLQDDGALDALELTGGGSFGNPMYLFRGDAPVHEMTAVMPRAARPAFRLFGKRFLKAYPFEEAYFLPQAREFLATLSIPLILLGGVNRRSTVDQAIEEGFAFVAMGRALLREPDLVARFAAQSATEATCIHCNKCMPTIYTGTHCVLDAPGA
jgi:2,4-dienoyl-CoA reductase-like NADH-dependent reductase (Old Yellow Enzyme family)